MFVARILYPVKVLGPGNRVGIWFAGCNHMCPGCSNPELWEMQERYRTDCDTVMQLIGRLKEQYPIDGFTLTGGDPFLQPDALRELLPRLTGINGDILVYTGFLYEELTGKYDDILSQIAVLIDGPYIEARNHGETLRGSDNQRILRLKPEFANKYETNGKSMIQNFATRDGIISVGIHLPGYEKSIDKAARSKGLEAK